MKYYFFLFIIISILYLQNEDIFGWKQIVDIKKKLIRYFLIKVC